MGRIDQRTQQYQGIILVHIQKAGYDMSSVSDYQRINSLIRIQFFTSRLMNMVLVSEKKHQLLIGAREVLWMDYSLFQNLNHKQHILNLLRPDNELSQLPILIGKKGIPRQI